MLTAQNLVEQAQKDIRQLDIAEVKNNYASHCILIDVREMEEIADGKIIAANAIPRGLLEWKIGQLPLVQQAINNSSKLPPIVVYCRSGGRSSLAAQSLLKMGFNNVYSMRGGITAWQEANYPIELSQNSSCENNQGENHAN